MRTVTLTLLLLASLIGGTFAAGLFTPADIALEMTADDEYDPCSDDPTATCGRLRVPVG